MTSPAWTACSICATVTLLSSVIGIAGDAIGWTDERLESLALWSFVACVVFFMIGCVVEVVR